MQGIREIALYTRREDQGTLLRNFRVLLSNDEQTWQTAYSSPYTAGIALVLPVAASARYVRVQLEDEGTHRALSLAEVRVRTNRHSFIARHSGMAITVYGADIHQGASIMQAPYDGGNNQRRPRPPRPPCHRDRSLRSRWQAG